VPGSTPDQQSPRVAQYRLWYAEVEERVVKASRSGGGSPGSQLRTTVVVRGPWGLFDVEAGRLALLEVRTPDGTHVEEHVRVRVLVLSRGEL